MTRLLSSFAALLLLVGGIGLSDAKAQAVNDTTNVVEVAVAADGFDTLVTALQATGLDEVLQGEGPFTILAPTDDAFAALGDELNRLLEEDNLDELADILSYHVIPAEAFAEDVVGMTEAPTVLGPNVGISVNDGTVTLSGANSAQVVQTDIDASNGVIHVIDTVLLPPEEN
jgi:uncharacterized surface protein with fasciclin (FAS1) repeats